MVIIDKEAIDLISEHYSKIFLNTISYITAIIRLGRRLLSSFELKGGELRMEFSILFYVIL